MTLILSPVGLVIKNTATFHWYTELLIQGFREMLVKILWTNLKLCGQKVSKFKRCMLFESEVSL